MYIERQMKERNGSIALEGHSKRNDQRINYTGVVDCVCFEEEEERATHLLRDTRKDRQD